MRDNPPKAEAGGEDFGEGAKQNHAVGSKRIDGRDVGALVTEFPVGTILKD